MCGVQVFIVFLDKGTVTIVSCALELGVKLGAGVSCSRGVWQREGNWADASFYVDGRFPIMGCK